MNDYRITTSLSLRTRHSTQRTSLGVVLLVMLGLLSIFTLIAVTFVVSAGHARRGAQASSRAEQMGDPFEVLLNQAMMQIARGSNHPQSAIGPHGLLEDMYGNSDAVTGAVFLNNGGAGYGDNVGPMVYDGFAGSTRSNTNAFNNLEAYSPPMLIEIGAVSFGWDREPGIALVDDSPTNSVIDDAAEWLAAGSDDCFLGETRAHPATLGIPRDKWQQAFSDINTCPYIDNVDNYYAGRVITFVNGDCAGQSSHIVRSKIVSQPDNEPTIFRTILFITPFPSGQQPRRTDRFVINGRPFSGAGFGYSPYDPVTGAKKDPLVSQSQLRALDMPYSKVHFDTPGYSFDSLEGDPEPVAILPNPVDSGYRDYLSRYAAIVDADEDYDAPDEQNMLLSYTPWVPDPVNGGGRYKTIIPSLHRPDVVRYHTREHTVTAMNPNGTDRWSAVPPYIRRRYILRPDPSDHYDYMQESGLTSATGGDGWTPGESFTDTNNNAQWDPGEKFDDANGNTYYDIGDRSFFNTGFDAMDGPWDVDNDGDGMADSIWVDLGSPVTSTPDGRFVKPLYAIMVRDLDGRINVNAHGSPKHYVRINNNTYKAEGGYDITTPPPAGRYNTEERVRIGMNNVALYQNDVVASGASAGSGTDVTSTHSVGDIDNNLNALSPQDVAFRNNRLFALAYRNDRPGESSLIANAAYMFDLLSFRDFQGNTNYDLMIRGFEPAVGQAYSVGDINIAPVLHNQIYGLPSMTSPATTVQSQTGNGAKSYERSNPYRKILEGAGNADGAAPPFVGRYGEGHLLRPPGRKTTSASSTSVGFYPGMGVVPRAGVTDLYRPRRDYYSPALVTTNSQAPMALVPEAGGAQVAVRGVTPSSWPRADVKYSQSQPPYAGDDDNPALPFRTVQNQAADSRFIFGSSGRNSFKQFYGDWQLDIFGDYVYNANGQRIPDPIVGDYGTPGDFDSDGFVALDIMGNPVFERMGTLHEDVDAPTEINLNRRYFAQVYFGAGAALRTGAGSPSRPNTADIDSPYTPPEFERILRYNDASSSILPSRLLDNISYGGGPGDTLRTMTTEQWDVPCPHVAPTPELSYALSKLNLPVNNPTIADLLRARFYLASGYDKPGFPTPVNVMQSGQLATIAMRSYRVGSQGAADQLAPAERNRMQTRLLSPDLGMGLKMDVNAPFGNGVDDNQNQVVDEPGEAAGLGSPIPDVMIAGLNAFYFDGNRDGNYLNGLDEEARQQYAKELYCLMMLLVDQNYVEPQPMAVDAQGVSLGAEQIQANFPILNTDALSASIYPYMNDSNKTIPSDLLPIKILKTKKWLFAHKIAQWAVNTVDFRDRDAIMTPFEFDADPFYDNDRDTVSSLSINYPNSNGTWDVDGYPARLQLGSLTALDPADDMDRPWRGLVWGCEYPDLILTETLAFHDRRTQNLQGVTATTNPGYNGLLFSLTNSLSTTSNVSDTLSDPDWDQRRIPQGTALFELFATGNRHNPALPRELYTPHTFFDPLTGTEVTELRLDLSAVCGDRYGANAGNVAPYPVWRLAITQTHTITNTGPTANITDTRMSVAERIQEWPMTCSLELNDPGMSFLNPKIFSNVATTQIPIERVVMFAPSNPLLALNAKSGLTNSANIEVYSNIYTPVASPDGMTTTTFPESYLLAPGDYAVVGPARAGIGQLRNITMIGRTENKAPSKSTDTVSGAVTVTDAPYSQPPAILDMGELNSQDYGTVRPFLMTSVNGVDEYPRSGKMTVASVTALGNYILPSAATGAVDEPGVGMNSQQIRPPLTIPCGLRSSDQRFVGLNISEPNTTGTALGYYPKPTVSGTDPWGSYMEPDTYARPYDVPLDDDLDGVRNATIRRNTSLPKLIASPKTGNEHVSNQTVLNIRTVFLQRLANPLLAWDLYRNPYLTVDWMPMDLTIFNGEPFFVQPVGPQAGTTGITAANLVEPFKDPLMPNLGDEPRYQNPTTPGPANAIRFGSRQRGSPRYPVKGVASLFDLWSQPNWLDTSPEFDTRPPPTGKVSDSKSIIVLAAPSTTMYKDYYKVDSVRWQDPLDHTLGYLNQGYHVNREWPTDSSIATANKLQQLPMREPVRRPLWNPPASATTLAQKAQFFAKQGWYTVQDVTAANSKYIGAPRRPFNWLTWNNRPFAGSMEMMLVPATSQARLMHEYSMRRTIPPSVPETGGGYGSRIAPFDPRRAANHYMAKVPAGGTTNWVPLQSKPTAGRPAVGYTVTAPFAHLLNFFESSDAVVSGVRSPQDPASAANFFRLFEFVTVPSRFSGTKQQQFHSRYNNSVAPGATQAGGNPTEHFGWPFTAPFNQYPLYREPGRININTIVPTAGHSFSINSTAVTSFARTHRNERFSDQGATIWRSVLNEFHPTIRWLPSIDDINNNGSGKMRNGFNFNPHLGVRAGTMTTADSGTNSKYFLNSSEDYVDNFYSLFASMFSNDVAYDPRGSDGVPSGDDSLGQPFSVLLSATGRSRHDSRRPSLFVNPFRSFMSDYSDAMPSGDKYRSAATATSGYRGDALLAADATLMRRRDTTWGPNHSNWQVSSSDAAGSDTSTTNKLFSPAQIDPSFDPMFTLNYPRPFRFPFVVGPDLVRQDPSFPSWWQISGYSVPLADARPGLKTPYNSASTAYIDTMRVRDTDFRNTDRNPFFRYQMYTKLSNTITTRSNVYAIWVTIGFFECERVQNGVAYPVQTGMDSSQEFQVKHRYPDGFRILREVGSDSGESQRHRAFAILDRTIPVGFLRGENLNVDRAFIIRHILD